MLRRTAGAASLVLAACGTGSGTAGGPPAELGDGAGGPEATPPVQVLAANDLGMHCMDREFSVYSILPPFNVVNAQVVRQIGGQPRLVDDGSVEVRYSAVADASGSINSHSASKTDFWDHVLGLFGVALPPGQGVTGLWMPADAPTPGPQPIAWEPKNGWFSAFGIPITPIDDGGATNPYPLLRISAHDKLTGHELAHTDVVVPVAQETDCQNCHATGAMAASKFGVNWSGHPDLELQTKENVLLLHDFEEGTQLFDAQPVLCASCHISPPLQLDENPGLTEAGGLPATPTGPLGSTPHVLCKEIPLFSAVMHGYHGKLLDPQGNPVFPPNGSSAATCYQCHPGAITQCQRGAMKTAGLECLQCHGDMLSVGGEYDLLPGGSMDGQNDGQPRRPWLDLPRCQSCHTGDAVSHLTGPGLVFAPDGIRLRQAFRNGDPSASPLLASNPRFAEDDWTRYRFSKGHGEIGCEGCHGSTHAEWPNADPAANDNVAATQIQGHSGVVVECSACHVDGSLPKNTLSGPHGMHQVASQSFVKDHKEIAEHNTGICMPCHGLNLLGTPLSRMRATRTFQIGDGKTITLTEGTVVACTKCHEMPN